MTMDGLRHIETALLLAAAVICLTAIAQRLRLPYPILLVLGGVALGLIPGIPPVRVEPDVVFLLFLPPILWAAAYFTSLRDFRRNLRPIGLLAVGLVLATTAVVAVLAHMLIPGIGWAEAIVLGAIISPPDAIAATSVARHLRIPRRIVTILEGESLVNDATALILYRASVAVVVSGAFSWQGVFLDFVLAVTLGIGVGLAVGWLTRYALRPLHDSASEIAITLIAPYVAWLLAERIHASAVLACVAGGFYLRRNFSREISPTTRLQARAVWEFVVFALNGLIFILIGLQLGILRTTIPSANWASYLAEGLMISVAAIVVRLIWVPTAAVLSRWLIPSLRRAEPKPPWKGIFVLGWTGMRGIVSLAAVLALPLVTASGEPFPHRDRFIVITFAVIFCTLVVQGLTLIPIIRRLGFDEDHTQHDEEALARKHAVERALARMESLRANVWVKPEHVERLQRHYAQRIGAQAENDEVTNYAFRRLRFETLTAERLALVELRDQGAMSDELLHELERELDFEAMRYGLGMQDARASINSTT
jgi:monovalent cation/hydrogen antiporter